MIEELPPVPGISQKDFPDKKISKTCVFQYSKNVLVDVGPPDKEDWVKWGSVYELEHLLEKEFPGQSPRFLEMTEPLLVVAALKKGASSANLE